jgi:uncharacterized protein YjbJ (UPF0337 family)
MDNDRIKGKWHQLKGEIKCKWGKVTDDDLTEAEGNMGKLVGFEMSQGPPFSPKDRV